MLYHKARDATYNITRIINLTRKYKVINEHTKLTFKLDIPKQVDTLINVIKATAKLQTSVTK